jgi:hypothetical protein
MTKSKRISIQVQGTPISILSQQEGDYISLTDMVRNFDGGGALIEQWLKNKDTVLFLGVWERINNPAFNSLEFEGIKNEAGRNSFFLSAKKWIELLVLANIEGMNAELIHMGLPQGERLNRLNAIAIRQMQVLVSASAVKQLTESNKHP